MIAVSFLNCTSIPISCEAASSEHLVQDNYSRSAKGVLRGFTIKRTRRRRASSLPASGAVFMMSQWTSGRVRRHFGKWIGVELTERTSTCSMFRPGFAHGFQVLSDTAEVMYKCTAEYSPADDRGIIWNDPGINIAGRSQTRSCRVRTKYIPRLHSRRYQFYLLERL